MFYLWETVSFPSSPSPSFATARSTFAKHSFMVPLQNSLHFLYGCMFFQTQVAKKETSWLILRMLISRVLLSLHTLLDVRRTGTSRRGPPSSCPSLALVFVLQSFVGQIWHFPLMMTKPRKLDEAFLAENDEAPYALTPIRTVI
jgi:hypothetical protein